MKKISQWLVLPDSHVPFHCKKYFKLILKILDTVKFDGIVHLGDCVDLFQLSKYDKDPARKNDARDDIEEYRSLMLSLANKLPAGSEYHITEGNHDRRAAKGLWGKAPEFASLVPPMPSMLGFKELNQTHKVKFKWHSFDNFKSLVINDTILMHGFYYDKHVAMNNISRYPGYNTLSGHCHRISYATNGIHWSATLGHCSDEKMTSHNPTFSGWDQAFGVLHTSNERSEIEIVRVKEGKCIFRGKLISI